MNTPSELEKFAQYINPQVDKSYSIRARLTSQIMIPEFINVGRVATEEPWDFIEHPHDSIEYHFIARGGMRTWIDREEVCVEAGQLYFVEPGQLHREESTSTPLETYYLKFNLLDLRGEPTPILKGGSPGAEGQVVRTDDGRLSQFFRDIFDEASASKPGCQEIIEAHLLGLFWETRRRMGVVLDSPSVVPTRQGEVVAKAQRYLEDNLGSPFSLEDLASHCSVSPDYLSRLFRENLGISPSQFSARVKVEVAKEWLAGSSRSVREIAFALGFQDEHYFSRRFKAMEQVSPTQFRRTIDGT